ncbi:MAG: 5-formyltetrahydrofolate cyclo-ligase [Stackebrandtia sp.]
MVTSTPDSAATARAKAALRVELRRARRELSQTVLDSAAERTATTLLKALAAVDAPTVAAYFPRQSEPGGALPELLRDAGHRVLLPVLRDDFDLDWAAYDGEAEPTVRGLREPAGARLGLDGVREADVVVAPGLAADADGVRLGQGGGCYDRVLARIASTVPTVLLLHDGEWPREVPRLEHDRAVKAVITPSGGYVRL